MGSPAASAEVQPAGRRPLRVRSQRAEEETCHDAPASTAHRVVELVVHAALALDDDDVAVALCGSGCPAGAPSIGARGRDREGPVVALVAVVGAVGAERDRDAALRGADERVGDPVLRLRVAEVQVDVVPGGLRADQRGGVGGRRRAR